MSSQHPGSVLNNLVEQALQKKSLSDMEEGAMNLYNLCCLLVDIQVRNKKESARKELPGQHPPVDLSLEVGQQEGPDDGQ